MTSKLPIDTIGRRERRGGITGGRMANYKIRMGRGFARKWDLPSALPDAPPAEGDLAAEESCQNKFLLLNMI
jgi:hypothetical protein